MVEEAKMELVVKDKGGDWCFDGDKTYWCLDKNKEVVGKIYAEYIPDPIKLWQEKCKMAGIETSSIEAKVFKTSKVATKLWEHSYADINS